jgi:hypothetical protein
MDAILEERPPGGTRVAHLRPAVDGLAWPDETDLAIGA